MRFELADASALPGSLLRHAGLVLLASLAWDAALRQRVYARLLAHLPCGALLVDYAAPPALPADALPADACARRLEAVCGGAAAAAVVDTSWARGQAMFFARVVEETRVEDGKMAPCASNTGTGSKF